MAELTPEQLKQASDQLIKAVSDMTDQYRQSYAELKHYYDPDYRSIKKKIIQQREHEAVAISKTAQTFEALQKVAKTLADSDRKTMSVSEELQKTYQALIATVKNDKQGELLTSEITAATKAFKDFNANQKTNEDINKRSFKTNHLLTLSSIRLKNKLNDLHVKASELRDSENKRLGITIKEIDLQEKKLKRYDDLMGAIDGSVKSFFNLRSATAQVVLGITRTFDELEYAVQHRMGLQSKVGNAYADTAMRLGLAPKELMQIISDIKPTIQASAGAYDTANGAISNMIETFAGLNAAAFEVTGSHTEANKLIANIMKTMTNVGVARNFEEMSKEIKGPGGILSSLAKLADMTSKSVPELQGMVDSFMQDEDVRNEMLKLDKKARMAKQAEILTIMKSDAAMGRMAEASLAAQKSLMALTGKSLQDRMESAANIMSAMATAGMEGGERLMQLMSKGTRTGDENTEIGNMLGELKEIGQKLRGRDDAGAQTRGQAIIDMINKSGMENIADTNTRALDEGRKKTGSQIQALDKNNERLGWLGKNMLELKNVYEKYIKATLADSGINMGMGVFAGIGSFIADGISTAIALTIGKIVFSGGIFASLKMIFTGLSKLFLPLSGVVIAAMTMFESAEESAANVGGIFGTDSPFSKFLNKLFSFLRNFGDFLSFGFADDVGSWLGGGIADVFDTVGNVFKADTKEDYSRQSIEAGIERKKIEADQLRQTQLASAATEDYSRQSIEAGIERKKVESEQLIQMQKEEKAKQDATAIEQTEQLRKTTIVMEKLLVATTKGNNIAETALETNKEQTAVTHTIARTQKKVPFVAPEVPAN